MSNRASLEDKYTLVCKICKEEFVDPTKKPRQKYGICKTCGNTHGAIRAVRSASESLDMVRAKFIVLAHARQDDRLHNSIKCLETAIASCEAAMLCIEGNPTLFKRALDRAQAELLKISVTY